MSGKRLLRLQDWTLSHMLTRKSEAPSYAPCIAGQAAQQLPNSRLVEAVEERLVEALGESAWSGNLPQRSCLCDGARMRKTSVYIYRAILTEYLLHVMPAHGTLIDKPFLGNVAKSSQQVQNG